MVTGRQKNLQDFQAQAFWMTDIFSRFFFPCPAYDMRSLQAYRDIVDINGMFAFGKLLWICNESCFPKIHHNANHFEKKYHKYLGNMLINYKVMMTATCSMKNQVNRPNEHQVTITLHMLSKGLQLCDTEFTDLKVS